MHNESKDNGGRYGNGELRKTHKFLQILSYATITAAILLFIFIAYLAMYPKEVVRVNTDPGPIPVIEKQVKIGDPLKIQVDVCYLHDSDATIKRKLVPVVTNGEQIFNYDDLLISIRRQCINTVSATTIIPEIAPGRYYLLYQTEYRMNPFRTINYSQRTEEFEILP